MSTATTPSHPGRPHRHGAHGSHGAHGEVRTSGAPRSAVPDRVRTPLLQLITQESLDLDYQHVAERRAERAGAPAQSGQSSQGGKGGKAERPSRSRTAATAAVVVAFGLLVALAGVQTSRTAPARQASQEDLIARVTASRQSVAALQQQVQTEKLALTGAQHDYAALGTTLSQTTSQLSALQQHTGFAAMSGSGVVVTVADNPNGDPADEVEDKDLSNLANGLWAAGATAIAVNGHRLTALSALRNSGSVIRVNGASLSSPYEVVALGDAKTLAARFAQTSSGSRFYDTTGTLGMPTSVDNGSNLTVPAASAPHLRYAAPATTPSHANTHQEGK